VNNNSCCQIGARLISALFVSAAVTDNRHLSVSLLLHHDDEPNTPSNNNLAVLGDYDLCLAPQKQQQQQQHICSSRLSACGGNATIIIAVAVTAKSRDTSRLDC
jgi:hypothetical protein